MDLMYYLAVLIIYERLVSSCMQAPMSRISEADESSGGNLSWMSLDQIQELWHGVGEGISISKRLFVIEVLQYHCLRVCLREGKRFVESDASHSSRILFEFRKA